MIGLSIKRFAHICKSLMKHPYYCKLFCPTCYEEAQEILEAKVNYFKLYLLDESYSIDKAVLSRMYRAYQKVLHPDILRAYGINNPNYSKFLSEAFDVLRDDVKRGLYLLKVKQMESEIESDDIGFLEEQLEMRVKLHENPQEARGIVEKAKADMKILVSDIGLAIQNKDGKTAKRLLNQLKFFTTFLDEAKQKLTVV